MKHISRYNEPPAIKQTVTKKRKILATSCFVLASPARLCAPFITMPIKSSMLRALIRIQLSITNGGAARSVKPPKYESVVLEILIRVYSWLIAEIFH